MISRIWTHRKSPFNVLSYSRHGCPTLYMGLTSLVLSWSELKSLSLHQNNYLLKLQRLLPKTPSCAVMLPASSLLAEALLAMKKFSFLGMIARLGPSNILFQQPMFSLTNDITSSWFHDTRLLTLLYPLPDHFILLNDPPSQISWKETVKCHVTSFWHQKYCLEDSHSLTGKLHPLWSSCKSSATAVGASTIQWRILSGRYVTNLLRSRWDEHYWSCHLYQL